MKVSEDNETNGINSIFDDKNSSVVARYNLQGQRVDASHRGVTIIKMSNGKTVKKILN